MPLTYRRLAATIGLVGGSLSLVHRLSPSVSQRIDHALLFLTDWLSAARFALNGLGAPGLGVGTPLGGLGDVALLALLAGLVAALLYERQPRWVHDVEELVARWRTRGRSRRLSRAARKA